MQVLCYKMPRLCMYVFMDVCMYVRMYVRLYLYLTHYHASSMLQNAMMFVHQFSDGSMSVSLSCTLMNVSLTHTVNACQTAHIQVPNSVCMSVCMLYAYMHELMQHIFCTVYDYMHALMYIVRNACMHPDKTHTDHVHIQNRHTHKSSKQHRNTSAS